MPNVQALPQTRPWTATAGRIPGVAYMMVVIVVLFSSLNRQFLDGANLVNIGSQASILLLLALPMTFVILTEGIDVSAGASA